MNNNELDQAKEFNKVVLKASLAKFARAVIKFTKEEEMEDEPLQYVADNMVAMAGAIYQHIGIDPDINHILKSVGGEADVQAQRAD